MLAKDGRYDHTHKDGADMVTLTRINGARFALNPDLIERVDRTPDTVITLVDGTKYLVRESLDEVVDAVLDFRARVLAAGAFGRTEDNGRRAWLSAVPTQEDRREPLEQLEPAAEVAEYADAPIVPFAPRGS